MVPFLPRTGYYELELILGSIFSSSFIAMAATLALPLFHEWEAQRKSQLSTTEWMAGYFILNFVTVWLLTRVAEVFGMGVSSIVVVGVLALVLDFVQGMAMMGLNNQQKN